MSWANGRQLTSVDGTTFAYNADGQRLFKNSNSKSVMYLVVDGVAVGESINNGQTTIYYLFDENSSIYGINVGGLDYFFRKNLQGDVVGIWDNEGTQIVTYTYDPWGKLLSMTDNSGTGLGTLNPFRYRTYYYDTETGFYYLQSRYYDPEIGRFINADGQLNDDILGCNLFAYCGNNPINRADGTGEFWNWVIGAAVGFVAGAVTSIVTQAISGNGINVRSVFASAAAGTVTGLLMATPGAQGVALTLGQTMLWGAVSSGIGYGVYNLVNGTEPTVSGYVDAMVGGAFLSGVGYAMQNTVRTPSVRVSNPQSILSNKTYTNNTGKVHNYESPKIGYGAAKSDFNSLKLANTRTYSNGAIVGDIGDSITVTLYKATSTKGPSISILYRSSHKLIKIRY